ncbi:glycosyltransferase family 4 protein [Infirmifilum lucidum]|uniref:Glycosyltransferase family 4 protein n=1 Tax=Infirmifilum lucidum TaxID=2776706 RepID=A0A7L9FK36_9CREN|nr:glycosyltransferase family 4 protein [Infirmifilum lucidum]QOJ79304.1 glycosyltransferase family 4 protein [Infirmifilum lucidum]
MGALELKKSIFKGLAIIDYMDVILEEGAELPYYHYLNLKNSDGVIFWSKAFMSRLKGIIPNIRSLYLPFGVSLNLFNPRKIGDSIFINKYPFLKNRFKLLYSGGIWRGSRGEDYQGVDKLPNILDRLRKYLPSKKVTLILNSPLDRILYKAFKETATLNQVLWIPPLPSSSIIRQSMFSAADICILPASTYPSIYYAERMKMFEYMAAGKAIVAEETPGAKGVLRNGFNASLTKLNDVEDFSEKIVTLIEDRDLRLQLGENAYNDILQNYEWRILAQRLALFLESLVNSI